MGSPPIKPPTRGKLASIPFGLAAAADAEGLAWAFAPVGLGAVVGTPGVGREGPAEVAVAFAAACQLINSHTKRNSFFEGKKGGNGRRYLCCSFERHLHLFHVLRLGVAADLLVLCAAGIGVGAMVECSGHAGHTGYAAGIGLGRCWCRICDEGEDREDREQVVEDIEASHFVW